jgi:hypothetical protein
VELDPNFAAAYGNMSVVYFNYREPKLAAERISVKRTNCGRR